MCKGLWIRVLGAVRRGARLKPFHDHLKPARCVRFDAKLRALPGFARVIACSDAGVNSGMVDPTVSWFKDDDFGMGPVGTK